MGKHRTVFHLARYGILSAIMPLLLVASGTGEYTGLEKETSISNKRNIDDNHKPILNCENLHPEVKEDQPKGEYVTTVTAIDDDPKDRGGTITYSIVQRDPSHRTFHIDNTTGVVTTATSFERDDPSRTKEQYVTVQAIDNGRPPLADVCTFKVIILDINDNYPVFDKAVYDENVSEDLKEGKEVMRVVAYDIDDGDNARLTYTFKGPSSSNFQEYFRINNATGVVYLKKILAGQTGNTFNTKVEVRDNPADDDYKSAEVALSITVVSSDKKAPSFIQVPTEPISLKENLADYENPIAILRAESNIPDSGLQFQLIKGKTTQTNKAQTFKLTQQDQTANITLARALDYETVTEYKLTVRVTNKDELAATVDITLKIEDVNDEIPTFIDTSDGSVVENEEPGVVAMTVRAVDKDGTEANNIVRYELLDHKDLFKIDPVNGIVTALKTFDREETLSYLIRIRAYDNSPSAVYKENKPNEDIQTFKIGIEDRNDNKPQFKPSYYFADGIPESANVGRDVTEVTAKDKDGASEITYSITDGNIDDAFTIEETTGRIKVKSSLDFEKIENYTLTVRAFDGIYEDFAKVSIKIENENDEVPVFDTYDKNITNIEEESIPNECIITLKARDPDKKDPEEDQRIVYRVSQPYDKFLSVTSNPNGEACVKLIKKLDRDPPNGSPVYQAFIFAFDNDGNEQGSQNSAAEINIILIDINDNEPYLTTTETVWKERDPPGNIIELMANDNDDPAKNGPPFQFRISENAGDDIKEKFSVDNNMLRANVVFDREEQKYYDILIAITDSGVPRKTGESVIRVIIGDVNDNPAQPGTSEIFVYTYENAPSTDVVIGRVYVDDLDDWDLDDKYFEWYEDNPNFMLNKNDGNITMRGTTAPGNYTLRFTVQESSALGLFETHSVDATVYVTVKGINETAVEKSGSIRLSGITVEEFVAKSLTTQSKKDSLQDHLATILNTSAENVDVFTVLRTPSNASYIDVRFSAHGSPYYSPIRLNRIIDQTKNELETKLSAKFEMISISECLDEEGACYHDACTDNLHVDPQRPVAVVYTNQTSFVGVRAVVEAKCVCQLDKVTCFNDGVPDGRGGCVCKEGYEGSHCEVPSIAFNGNGWALYPTFSACNRSHIVLEVVPSDKDGVIFYVGPLSPGLPTYAQDFMLLYLKDGYPVLLLDYGTGISRTELKYRRLTDGASHSINIQLQPQITIWVDDCRKSDCQQLGEPVGNNSFLNVNGPLQIGGTITSLTTISEALKWNVEVPTKGFYGCIKNFRFNNYTYNLGVPDDFKEAHPNCDFGVAKAVSFGIDTKFLVAILVCIAILLILMLAVVVHRRKQDHWNEKEMDDARETIIDYQVEGGGEYDAQFNMDVLRFGDDEKPPINDNLDAPPATADIRGFLDSKKDSCDQDPDNLPFDDVRYYAYEGDGNSTGSLSSLASCTDEGDLKFSYLSNFGPRFRKLADMYGEDPSDEDSQDGGEESWC